MNRKLTIKTQVFNQIRKLFKTPFFEKMLVYFASGKTPESLIGKILPSCYLYKKGSIRFVERNGIKYKLDISDMVDWYIYYNLHDPSHYKLLSLCKEDSTILDVGTNNGSMLLNLSKIAKKGFVYGFEADPVNFERCMQNISLNTIHNNKVINKGLHKEEGQAFIGTLDSNNLGMNRINGVNSVTKRPIQLTTIDNFIEQENNIKIDVIKIDTEGFELNVLMGAHKTLAKNHPKLFIELDDNNLKENGQSAKMLVEFLIRNYNYSIVNCNSDKQIVVEDDFSNCHYDIIAT